MTATSTVTQHDRPTAPDFDTTAQAVLSALVRRYPNGVALTLLDLHSALAFDARTVPTLAGADSTLRALRVASWVPAPTTDDRDVVRRWFSPQETQNTFYPSHVVDRAQIVATYLQDLLGTLPGRVVEPVVEAVEDAPAEETVPADAPEPTEAAPAGPTLAEMFLAALTFGGDGQVTQIDGRVWGKAVAAALAVGAEIPREVTGLRRKSPYPQNVWLTNGARALAMLLDAARVSEARRGFMDRDNEEDDAVAHECLNKHALNMTFVDDAPAPAMPAPEPVVDIVQAFHNALDYDRDSDIVEIDQAAWDKAMSLSGGVIPDEIARKPNQHDRPAWFYKGVRLLHGADVDHALDEAMSAMSDAPGADTSPEAFDIVARFVRDGEAAVAVPAAQDDAVDGVTPAPATAPATAPAPEPAESPLPTREEIALVYFQSALTLDSDGDIVDIDRARWDSARSIAGGNVPDEIARMTNDYDKSAWRYRGVLFLHGQAADRAMRAETDFMDLCSSEALDIIARFVRTGK